MATIIEIKNLNLSFGSKEVFKDFNLNIEESSFTTLMGASGSGKTTLANIFLGLYSYRGDIKVSGKSLKEKINDIRVVSENHEFQFISDTVEEELLIPFDYSNYSADDAKKIIGELTDRLGITHLLKHNLHHLSYGEKQLVMIACAILCEPKILILDNALCMIDNYTKTGIIKCLKECQNKNGLTIINMTQNPEEILLGSDLVIINYGKVVLHKRVRGAFESEKVFREAKVSMPFIIDLCFKLRYYQLIDKIELGRTRLVKEIWK